MSELYTWVRSDSKKLLIGRCLPGWCFRLCIYPEYDLLTVADWERTIKDDSGSYIQVTTGHSGHTITLDSLMSTILGRCATTPLDPAWVVRNSASVDPESGLARMKIGISCYAHGDGPYDLVLGMVK